MLRILPGASIRALSERIETSKMPFGPTQRPGWIKMDFYLELPYFIEPVKPEYLRFNSPFAEPVLSEVEV